jgi:hypothetical protein
MRCRFQVPRIELAMPTRRNHGGISRQTCDIWAKSGLTRGAQRAFSAGMTEPRKTLSPAAERALAEAAARHAARAEKAVERPKEANGPKGPEPTRYGDWERNGIASDF